MDRITKWLAVGAAAAVVVLPNAGQSATASKGETSLEPVAPPVDTLVAWALARAPEIRLQRERAAAAGERAATTAARPDPMLEVALENAGLSNYTVGEDEMSMWEVELRQEFAWPGKGSSRRRAAMAGAHVDSLSLETVEREVAATVQVLCARLYALDQERQALESGREIGRLLESAAAARYGSGQAEMEAQIKAQLSISRLEERRTDVEAERRILAAQLGRYVGHDRSGNVGRFIVLPEPAPPPADWQDRLIAQAPAVRMARASADAAALEVVALQSEGKPDLFVGAGYGYRGGFDPMVSLRVGTGLPIGRGNRVSARQRAAAHDEAQALAATDQQTAALVANGARWVADWQRADSQVRRYRDAIVPQSRLALEAARTAYAAGKSDFSTVAEDLNLWLDSQRDLAVREADRFEASARLEELVAPSPNVNSKEGGR